MSDYRGVDFSERTNVTIKNTEIREFDIGISFFHSLNCIATRNKLANNGFGILVSNSSNNFIIGNNIMTNYFFGILLEWSSNNKVYHNNFIDNWSDLGLVDSTNVWDNGYPSGGNYWDGYTGADARRGPNQDQPGSDGIGDTPYIMYGVIDHYPLMSPYGAPAPKPVGGISFAMEGFAPIQPFTQYLGLVAILAIGFTAFKRKTARKTK
jgi:parallel beta-helix repeat protein